MPPGIGAGVIEVGLVLPPPALLPEAAADAGPGRTSWEVVEATTRRAEALGFGSLWMVDGPAAERSQPAGALGDMAWTDPFPALGALARITRRVRLGVLGLRPERAAATITAKQLATLDVLAGGRVVAGPGLGPGGGSVGASSGAPATGDAARTQSEECLGRLEEFVLVVRGMFGGGPYSFQGHYEAAHGARCLPVPVQGPGLPLWLHGASDHLLDLVARVGDGWIAGWSWEPGPYAGRAAALEVACERSGRDPATVTRSIVTLGLVAEDQADLARRFARWQFERMAQGSRAPELEEWRRGRLVGSVDQVREQLQAWEGLGVSTVVVGAAGFPGSAPAADDLALLADACRL